jgi:hypothetical protein
MTLTNFNRREGVKRYAWVHFSLLLVICGLLPIVLIARPKWKTFSNRAGWSIAYPADWSISSCRSCSDPTAPDVYVDFFPPNKQGAGSSVMVQHLADQPSNVTLDQWFAEIKRTANQNPQVSEERVSLDGRAALKVRYRNPNNGGYWLEAVYVVAHGQTFSIDFSGEAGVPALEPLENYKIYLDMVKSLKLKH